MARKLLVWLVSRRMFGCHVLAMEWVAYRNSHGHGHGLFLHLASPLYALFQLPLWSCNAGWNLFRHPECENDVNPRWTDVYLACLGG